MIPVSLSRCCHSEALEAKEARLRELLASYESVIVAFSGGADSAYLAWAATSVLGQSALCITADSPSYPDRHRQLALTVAREAGLRHEIIQTSELDRAEYRANPTNRCYYCKHELYTALTGIASDRGFAVVADGSNADDRGDYRPGRQAAREFGVRSPLDEAGLTKAEIRELSRRAGLRTWDEPASACLSSRIPYHSEVTRGKAARDRARRGRAALAGFSRVPGPSSRAAASEETDRRRRWRDSRSPATNCRARSIRTFAPGSCAKFGPSVINTSRSISRGIGWAASTRVFVWIRSSERRAFSPLALRTVAPPHDRTLALCCVIPLKSSSIRADIN